MNAVAELVGEYTVIRGEKFGRPIPRERVYGTSVRFTDDTITVVDAQDQEMYGATYQLDTDQTPWHIVMTATNAPNSGDVAQGLIEKDGDMVRLIYSLPGAEPPTDFRTGPKQLLFVMENQNK
jgi:uncharacterized protein (TIGR03067 family)